MIEKLAFKNFGPLKDIQWNNLGKINLVIGGNGSGKTFLLKAIYCSLRTIEEYKRGQEPRSAAEILASKLYWTFQAEKIGDLVSKGSKSSLSSSLTINERIFSYSFGRDTSQQISLLLHNIIPRKSNSIFLPSKEVLSIIPVILKSREQDKVFGFDDTYFDLARVMIPLSVLNLVYEDNEIRNRLINYVLTDLEKDRAVDESVKVEVSNLIETAYKKLHSELKNQKKKERIASRSLNEYRLKIRNIIDGSIEFDNNSNNWLFVKGRNKFPMGLTAEGIKKIGIFDILLASGYIDSGSIILIDEPEANLHPAAISQLLDIVVLLAESGMQFFMASHSYFVVKKLYLIAQERGWSIPVLSHDDGEWKMDDLKEGMPDNPIIQEAINLYKQEMDM